MMNSRNMLLTFCVATAVSLPAAPNLKTAFANAFKIGVATNAQIDAGQDLDTRRIVIEQFNTITAENELKAGPLCPEPGVYDFTAADQFVAFGETYDMFRVGHTLVWHNQTPDWFFTDEDGESDGPGGGLGRADPHRITAVETQDGPGDVSDALQPHQYGYR